MCVIGSMCRDRWTLSHCSVSKVRAVWKGQSFRINCACLASVYSSFWWTAQFPLLFCRMAHSSVHIHVLWNLMMVHDHRLLTISGGLWLSQPLDANRDGWDWHPCWEIKTEEEKADIGSGARPWQERKDLVGKPGRIKIWACSENSWR